MINYSVKVGDFAEDQSDDFSSHQSIGQNPFPGLRPFTIDECHLFFGREGPVDEILLKLSHHRSVTVMGYSGSGKSSLMYCGLVPVLYGGFMTDSSPFWQVVTARPGISPVHNLATAIADFMVAQKRIEARDYAIHKAIVLSVLQSGSHGLVDIARYLQTRKGENIFLLVDQFEELFRFREATTEFVDESTAFVNLILAAVHQREVPIYVSIDMRSDFIGACSIFPGLTQMINQSNYLVPQMTREQKRMAIIGPVAVGGGKISQRLVKRLLSDIGDNQDQLPILQHALMRTWDYWVENREQGEPMDIRHYNAVGRITQALSLHANEAYDELTAREKEIAEILFKNITERNQENKGLRRPCKVGLVAELAEASEAEVIRVVDHFRQPGRSFLMPGLNVSLDAGSTVELSHESLMRIWNRLAGWVGEEAESASMYKRLSEAAAMYQIGKTGLWRPPDLQLALNWQKKQRPTRTWAQRYDAAFERAIVFLDTSRITYEAELKNQELLQQRILRRAKTTSVVLGIAALIAILFMVYGFTQQIAAKQGYETAELRRIEADKQRQNAENEKSRAEQKTQEVIDQQKLLEQAIGRVNRALQDVREAKKLADQSRIYAEQQRDSAESRKSIAIQATEYAQQQYEIAQQALKDSKRLLMLSIAQSLEAKAETTEDKDLAGLLAMQGYLFHTQFEGEKYDPYVFAGLYSALEKLSGINYNAIHVPGKLINKMFALALSGKSSVFFTSGNDGRIFSGDFKSLTVSDQVAQNPFASRTLELSTDERFLINGTDSSFIEVFDLTSKGKRSLIKGHKSVVNDIKFLPGKYSFVSASNDKSIRLNDPVSGLSTLLINMPFSLKAFDIAPNGKYLIGGATTGQLVYVDLIQKTFKILHEEGRNRILSVSHHPNSSLIAFGTDVINDKSVSSRGLVKLFDLNTGRITKELTGHKAGVSDVKFSPNGLLIASAGYDRKLQMWVVGKEEKLPIVMDNNNGNIWRIAFSVNSDYLLASCNNGEIRVWQTEARKLAEQICPKLSRNMSMEEWKIYVGNDIGYEATCKSLLISDF